jgi:hypothetical protein
MKSVAFILLWLQLPLFLYCQTIRQGFDRKPLNDPGVRSGNLT